MAKSYTPLRLFILEGPDPMDLLQGRSEAEALEKICHLIGHEVTVLRAISATDLENACKFIASINSSQDRFRREKVPLCIHLAAHGNNDGLAFGPAVITWHSLLTILHPICADLDNYDGLVIFVISACGAAAQTLTREFQNIYGKNKWFLPPIYLFVNADDMPTFPDAAVSWAVFYHHLPRVNLDDKQQVQDVLRKVKEAGAATIMYYRWDKNQKRYLRHIPK